MSSVASTLMPSPSMEATQCGQDVGVFPGTGEGVALSPKQWSMDVVSPALGSTPKGCTLGLVNKVGAPAPCADFDRSRAAVCLNKLRGSWLYEATHNLSAAAVLTQLQPKRIPSGGVKGMKAEVSELISKHKLDDTFYVIDLANVVRLHQAWKAAMPRVVPFYAVKCYPEPGMLRLMAALGTGFDCASKGEVEAVLSLGVAPNRIIFAHPCKRPCDMRYAREKGVEHTTFDTESELHKIAVHNPGFKCVLRIRADDPEARVPLGLKYGANPEEAPRLLAVAAQLKLEVVGVSFHVGSACKNLATFTTAIEKAREIFDLGSNMGFTMDLLDIGGGFTGQFDPMGNVMFGDIATTINNALAASFPPEMGVAVIAEPGRYFAESAAALMTPVYGVRDRPDASGRVKKDYWITDGLYGSFNCILYDGQNPQYHILRSPLLPAAGDMPVYTSTLWGPTCDSADVVYKDVQLPLLRTGDWLVFPNAGAYTVAGACDFNGIEFTTPNKFYVYSDKAVDVYEGEGSADEVTERADAAPPWAAAVPVPGGTGP